MYLYELLSIPICVDIQILSKCLFQNLCEYYLIQYIYRMLNCQSVTNVCSSTSPQPRATSELQCQVNFTSSSQWCMMQHNCHACHFLSPQCDWHARESKCTYNHATPIAEDDDADNSNNNGQSVLCCIVSWWWWCRAFYRLCQRCYAKSPFNTNH